MVPSRANTLCSSTEPGLCVTAPCLGLRHLRLAAVHGSTNALSLCATVSSSRWAAGTSGSFTPENSAPSVCSVAAYLSVTLFVSQPGGDPGAGLCRWQMVLSHAIAFSAAAWAMPCLPMACWGPLAGPR